MKEKEVICLPLILAGNTRDPNSIIASVSLPAAVWERLTAHLKGFDREIFHRADLPDMPLLARIEEFLDVELLSWEASVTEYPAYDPEDDSDLDDGLPF